MPINRKHKRQYTQDGEAGFTLIEMIMVVVISSILGTFIFGVLTKSLSAQIAMQERKERSDDANLVQEKISREVKEATAINNTCSNHLVFEKNVTSSTDTNKFVKFVRNPSTNRLWRQSATTYGGLPGNNNSGNIVAENVTVFNSSTAQAYGSSLNVIILDLAFDSGSVWQTKVFPRNYNLP